MARRKRFNIMPISIGYDDEDIELKSYYESWRHFNSESNEGFFAIFNSFKDKHLATIDPSALRLYLYFGFAARNQHGHSWWGVESIAEFFKTQPRTVNNWINKLVAAGLIYRDRKGRKSSTTYLLPYGPTLVKSKLEKTYTVDDETIIKDMIARLKKFRHIYGDVVGIFHTFQWGIKPKSREKEPSVKNSLQWLLIITRRTNGILTAHYQLLKNSDHLGVALLNIEEYRLFRSPILYNGVPITGIALNHRSRLEHDYEAVLEIIDDLAKIDDSFLNEAHYVEYGIIKDILEFDEDTEDSKELNDKPEGDIKTSTAGEGT